MDLMAGYSETPLPTKLGMREGDSVFLLKVPREVRSKLGTTLLHCRERRSAGKGLDFLMVFARSELDLLEAYRVAVESLTADGMIWACWPKRSSGVSSEVGEGSVRSMGLAAGLVDVKVCAVTETWSGLKFVRRRSDRAKEPNESKRPPKVGPARPPRVRRSGSK
jgi:hypothetical protein